MAWIQLGIAAIGAYSANRANKKNKDALTQSQGNAQVNIENALREAQGQQSAYSDIGRRDGLYRLAALMGDDRFGSKEAAELYELKAPSLQQYGPYTEAELKAPLGLPDFLGDAFGENIHAGSPSFSVLRGKKNKQRKREQEEYVAKLKAAQEKYQGDLSAYNTKKSELEQAVAKQKADGTYRVGSDYLADTDSYKFRYGQGQKNTLRALSANRGVLGGGALKDLEEYGQNFASNEFNNEFNRLSTLAGVGQNAATAIGNAATGSGSNLANLALQGGSTLSDYYNNQNNVTQGTLGNVAYLGARRNSSYRKNPYSAWSDYEEQKERA